MTAYSVHIVVTITHDIDVEVDDEETAVELVYEQYCEITNQDDGEYCGAIARLVTNLETGEKRVRV